MAKRQRTGPTMVQRSRRVSPQEKAFYHQVTGAGPSHTKREFLGLTDTEIAKMKDRLDQLIRRKVERG